MFGFRNFTGYSFVAKIGKFEVEFTAGVLEEVTFNVTGSIAANAAEISDNFDFNLSVRDKLIASTSLTLSSKIIESNVCKLIAGATTNLFI